MRPIENKGIKKEMGDLVMGGFGYLGAKAWYWFFLENNKVLFRNRTHTKLWPPNNQIPP